MKKNHLDHGLHNEKVCKYLNNKPEFADWIITTAFYASMHLIYGKILPVVIRSGNGKARILTFEDLYNYHMAGKPSMSKHKFSLNYIEENHPNMANQYQFLLDNCNMARYHKYDFPRDISKLAYQYMQEIKKFCTTDDTVK
jgi:hypothetical protein